jgi:hypothetical protein
MWRSAAREHRYTLLRLTSCTRSHAGLRRLDRVVVGGRDAGVVEGDVDGAELGGDPVEKGVDGCLVGHVHGAEDAAHLHGGARSGIRVEVGDDDGRTFGGEPPGGREADAARTSGDDRDAAGEALGQVHGSRSLSWVRWWRRRRSWSR